MMIERSIVESFIGKSSRPTKGQGDDDPGGLVVVRIDESSGNAAHAGQELAKDQHRLPAKAVHHQTDEDVRGDLDQSRQDKVHVRVTGQIHGATASMIKLVLALRQTLKRTSG
jgi:hypothetical protein